MHPEACITGAYFRQICRPNMNSTTRNFILWFKKHIRCWLATLIWLATPIPWLAALARLILQPQPHWPGWGCTDLNHARGAQGILPWGWGYDQSIGSPYLTPLPIAGCGRLQLGVLYSTASADLALHSVIVDSPLRGSWPLSGEARPGLSTERFYSNSLILYINCVIGQIHIAKALMRLARFMFGLPVSLINAPMIHASGVNHVLFALL